MSAQVTSVTVELPQPVIHGVTTLDPRMSVLVVVDIQNEECHPDGFRYPGPEAGETLVASQKLVTRAREAGVRIIWLKSVRTPDQPIFTVFGHEPYRIDGSWAVDFAEPVRPEPGEVVIKKYTHSPFIADTFKNHLVYEGIIGPVWSMIAIGGSLTTCLLETIKGLSMLDFKVVVPLDCVFPRSGREAAVPLYQLGQGTYAYTVRVVTGADDLVFGTNAVSR